MFGLEFNKCQLLQTRQQTNRLWSWKNVSASWAQTSCVKAIINWKEHVCFCAKHTNPSPSSFPVQLIFKMSQDHLTRVSSWDTQTPRHFTGSHKSWRHVTDTMISFTLNNFSHTTMYMISQLWKRKEKGNKKVWATTYKGFCFVWGLALRTATCNEPRKSWGD